MRGAAEAAPASWARHRDVTKADDQPLPPVPSTGTPSDEEGGQAMVEFALVIPTCC